MSRYASALYKKRSSDANLLVYSRFSQNSLERLLRSNAPEHSTKSEL